MSDKFFPIPLKQLLELILRELSSKDSYFGIPSELFYRPQPRAANAHASEVFNQYLVTPVGVAAGPHTQMAQNIVGAWLMGARYIELKTIQTLDELEVSKPCIDMQDEGYNCEWSQELKVNQSFDEYLNAWIIIHILNHRFGWPAALGTVFNMSVGYNLEGIKQDNVQWFLDQMRDSSILLHKRLEEVRELYPLIDEINIPSMISDNVTLSTMHGCPANEIEAIAKYLMEEKGLHTYVKLNPTLLGPDFLRDILNSKLGFLTEVPDMAFDHDLRYEDALSMISQLEKVAKRCSLDFGLKLTNTLESENHRDVFGPEVEQMYMSGRALHPLAINLARKLQHDFDGRLSLSFSAGADAFNIVEILGCGFKTVTVCSDLLKPGGYMRLQQYFEQIRFPAGDLTPDLYMKNLVDYAASVLDNPAYQRGSLLEPDIKTDRMLGLFDCISAPCRDTCATNQDIPDYMHFAAKRQYDKALEVILRTNPFPRVTGMVCDHLCQNKCTRVHYDDPLLIREVKRFIAENGMVSMQPEYPNGLEVAIIGAGPAGLSCAFFLTLAGFEVDVYESNDKAGGMVQYAIPGFRLTDGAFESDLKRITDLGVRIHYQTHVDKQRFKELKEKCHYLFIGAGAQLSAPLKIQGIEADGVVDPLAFLKRVKQGLEPGIGRHVVVIGGGNTAMDAARTAWRLVGEQGSVTVVYRRTISQMPADQGEVKAVMEEGIQVLELAGPEEVIVEEGRVVALRCNRMELSYTDESGRPKPIKIKGATFEVSCDTIIPAIGQLHAIDFLPKELLQASHDDYMTRSENVFIGGDALRGASTAINAIGDGRKAADQIMKQAFYDFLITMPYKHKERNPRDLIIKRAKRQFAAEITEKKVSERRNFQLVQKTLDEESVVEEATRCLYCNDLCNTCVTVCPNFANVAFEVDPVTINLQKIIRGDNGKDLKIKFDRVYEVEQTTQILNIANFCNECGNCETFCPTSGAPYKAKPAIHLSIESFYAADEGYYLSRLPDRDNLIYKSNNILMTLSETPDAYFFESPDVWVRFNKDRFRITEARFLTDEVVEAYLVQAANMMVIMQGVTEGTNRL